MNRSGRAWTYSELLAVFRLYCHTSFGKLHSRNPEIISIAKMMGRTPSSIAMKACNFASLDPNEQARDISALGNVSRADKALWDAFKQNPTQIADEAECAFSTLVGDPPAMPIAAAEVYPRVIPSGATETFALLRIRRVQSFFRSAVLVSYNQRCALTGIAVPELLNSSHIIPWCDDEQRRADPTNGICLNAFHDRAFDRGLMTFDEDFRAVISSVIPEYAEESAAQAMLRGAHGKPAVLPSRFLPDPTAMEYHRNRIFRG